MRVYLIGTGMGTEDTLTGAARRALTGAQAWLGAERLLAGFSSLAFTGEKFPLALPENVAACLGSHSHWKSAAVLLSGDVGFYSGAKRLRELLSGHELEVIPGISAPQYFAARLGRPWQDFRLASCHGVECDVVAEVLNHPAVFFLTGGQIGVEKLLGRLNEAGLGEAKVTVGENLSGEDERISEGTAAELQGETFSSLAVVLVENRKTFRRETLVAGIADAEFVRGDAPMTKSEVRAVALALLRPLPNSVLYDVGAGTGSVAVEMGLRARWGRVYAIERKDENLPLIQANRERFGVYNMRVVHGSAPGVFRGLPVPDAVFIGGSGGSMEVMVEALLGMNPAVRIVASAICLETLAAAMAVFREFALADFEVTQVAVCRTREVGSNHLLTALNPIFLISGGGSGLNGDFATLQR